MNTGSTIIGALFIILCTFPFVMMSIKRKRREKLMYHALDLCANSRGSRITNYEYCGDFSIGLDEEKKLVYFHKEKDDINVTACVELNQIQQCSIVNTSTMVGSNGSERRVIDKLELSFIPANKSTQIAKWEFYDDNVSVQLTGELQSIEHWQNKINSLINHKA